MSKMFIGKFELLPFRKKSMFCAATGLSYIGFNDIDSLAYFVADSFGATFKSMTTYQRPQRTSPLEDYFELDPKEREEFEEMVQKYIQKH